MVGGGSLFFLAIVADDTSVGVVASLRAVGTVVGRLAAN